MVVHSVLGELRPEDLGVTLMHEHVWVDRYPETGDYNRRLTDIPLVVRELGGLTDAGGVTLCDVTPPGIGRDPHALQRISRDTGLNIVMGSGWYLQEFHPPEVATWSVARLTEILVNELENGVGDTGIRPGIIGEIASGLVMTPAEERALRAASRAQRQTGLPLTTHAFGSEVSLHQIEVLGEEGADLSKCIIGHLDSMSESDLHEKIARSGAWVQFDLLRCVNEWEISASVDLICAVFERGFQSQLLLSHDVCMKSHLRAYGGTGYTAIFDHLVPALEKRGIAASEIRQLLVENPRRVFTADR